MAACVASNRLGQDTLDHQGVDVEKADLQQVKKGERAQHLLAINDHSRSRVVLDLRALSPKIMDTLISPSLLVRRVQVDEISSEESIALLATRAIGRVNGRVVRTVKSVNDP
jgi:hypothetical protein